jgi:serine/threonine-protein kinase RsbW
MSHSNGAEMQRVDRVLDSTLENVDVAEADVTRLAEQAGFDEEDLHRIGIAVRETMVNAVVHGNHYSTKKKVHFSVSLSLDHSNGEPPKDCLAIVIEDEGEGFHKQEVPNPLAEENLLRHSGRGLLLIEAFMDRFVIEPRTPQGTKVTLIKCRTRQVTPGA